jgi:hypothetical protein
MGGYRIQPFSSGAVNQIGTTHPMDPHRSGTSLRILQSRRRWFAVDKGNEWITAMATTVVST